MMYHLIDNIFLSFFKGVFFFFLNQFKFVYLLTAPLGMWDLVPWPGIEPMTPAVEARSLNHWTTREVQHFPFFVVHKASQSIVS